MHLSEFDILNKITLHKKIQRANLESRLIYLKGRNFRDSEDFSHFSLKFLPSKKFYQTFKKIDFAKYQLFLFLDIAKYFSKFEKQKYLAIFYFRKNFCTQKHLSLIKLNVHVNKNIRSNDFITCFYSTIVSYFLSKDFKVLCHLFM